MRTEQFLTVARMRTMAQWTAAEDEDADVASLLAFIDECEQSDQSHSEDDGHARGRKRRRSLTRGQELKQLRAIATRLQLEVNALKRRKKAPCFRPQLPLMEELWRAVAKSQAREREQAEGSNAVLRDTTEEQHRVVGRTAQLALEQIHRLTKLHRTRNLVPALSPLPSPIRPQLSPGQYLEDRLSALYAQSKRRAALTEGCDWGKREDHGGLAKQRLMEPTSYGGFQVLLREERVFPFKFSTVATQCWELTTMDSLKARCHLFEDPPIESDEIKSSLWIRVSQPYGGFEAHGGVILRRVYEENGDVLFLISSIAFPCGSDPKNLMKGFAILEEGWCRIRKCSNPGAPSLVHFESVGKYELRPLTQDQSKTQPRIQSLGSFLVRLLQDDTNHQAQRLENRLLDASLTTKPN